MLEKSVHFGVRDYLNKLLECLWAVVSQETAMVSLYYSHFHDYFSKSTFKIMGVWQVICCWL